MEIACNWKYLRFSIRGKQRQRTKSPFQSMTLELLVFYFRPLFPNSHKHYWEIPMFTISFGVLQKLFINSIYTHPLFSNLIPIQNSIKVRRYLPLPMAPDDWLTGSEFHRVACLSLVCRDRVDCKENIPIYFLPPPPPSTRVQRFPAKYPLTKRPSEGNSQIIAQLFCDARPYPPPENHHQGYKITYMR